MKKWFFILSLLAGHTVFANMASPFKSGTLTSSAFSSKNIDIVSEKITVFVKEQFLTANFHVEYTIKANTEGVQIPLLFVAEKYKGGFQVWVDDIPVNVLPLPDQYLNMDDEKFGNFKELFRKNKNIVIQWSNETKYTYATQDLKYFEVGLSKGIHRINIKYTADVWQDLTDWTKKYKFVYSLSPAKYWKSFDSLTIQFILPNNRRIITTNLGNPNQGNLSSNAIWYFNKIPAEYFEFTYQPPLNRTAKVLVKLDPMGAMVIIGVLLFLLHLWAIIWYRKKNLKRKFSIMVIIGSIILPFIILCVYPYWFGLIDDIIGPDASCYHGYSFLMIFLYPVFMPVYWVTVWLVDRIYTRKMLLRI